MPPSYQYSRCCSYSRGRVPRRPHVERLSWSSIGDAGSRQPHEDWLLLLDYEVVLGARQKLIDQLRGFLSRHEQRLSRASVGRIDDCIQALEDGSEDFELPGPRAEHARGDPPFPPGIGQSGGPGSARCPGGSDLPHRPFGERGGGLWALLDADGRPGTPRQGARGVRARARILRYFRACPNDLDLAWYLRGVGDLRASFDLLSKVRPIWSGAVLCLRGFLPRVVRDKVGWQHSQAIAAFLMGRPDALDVPFDLGWGEALVNADLPLMKGEFARARAVAAADLEGFKGACGTSPSRSGRGWSWPRSIDGRGMPTGPWPASNARRPGSCDRGRWSTSASIT